MKTQALITKISNGIYAQVTASVDTLAENGKAKVVGLRDKSIEDGLAIVSVIRDDIEAVLKAPRVDGVGLPAFLSKVSVEGDMTTLYVTVKTKLKSAYKYRKDAKVNVDENVIKNLAQVYIDALFEMFYIEAAMENVGELNTKLATIIAENEIPYSVEFVVDNDTDAMVIEVTNDKVVFNANVSRAQDIANYGIFQDEDANEFSKLVCAKAVESLVNALKAVQTPVQLIKANIQLIKDITGISTKKRASKLIRESYHRQAKYLDKVKTGIGYYNEDVEINGETVEVFALVGKAEDGSLSVVLNPFNVKDLFNVDYDVIAAVKAQMA